MAIGSIFFLLVLCGSYSLVMPDKETISTDKKPHDGPILGVEVELKGMKSSFDRVLKELANLKDRVSARDCLDLLRAGFNRTGIYNLVSGKPIYCDMDGGWLVFQRRLDGSVDFFRNWTEYRQGFGHLEGEFWLGLETLYRLTNDRNYKLRVELEDFENNHRYAEYSSFSVSDERITPCLSGTTVEMLEIPWQGIMGHSSRPKTGKMTIIRNTTVH